MDNNKIVVDALNQRLASLDAKPKAEAVVADFNNPKGILGEIRQRCSEGLYLILVDPTRCDVPFATIAALKRELGNTDFLVNVALGTDFNRNCQQVALDDSFADTRQRYESFLGVSFFSRSDVIDAARAGQPEKLRRFFADAYLESMRRIGLKYADVKPVRRYYYLLFASGHPTGLEFWRKACKYEPSGQATLGI